MPILQFLWLVIRPVRKFESAVGWWDVLDLLIWIAYPTIGVFSLNKLFEEASLAWFTGIPILLLLIAGIKLQFKLARFEKEKKPKLSVYDIYKEKYFSADCSRVGLIIKNGGTDVLNNCHARLVGIDFETPNSKLTFKIVPINKDIPCDSTIAGQSNGKVQAMTCHGLMGEEKIIIEYLDNTSRGIPLMWRQPILLLLHIWGENSKPIYVVCKVSKQTIGLDICVLESAPLQHDIKLSDFQTITPDKEDSQPE